MPRRRRGKVVVTHHPFDLPAGHGGKHLIGRSDMAMRQLAAAGADVFLAGHLHVSHVGHTAERYQIAGHSALVVQAGTLSTRGRGELNTINVLRLERPRITIERYTWDEAEQTFHPSWSGTFQRTRMDGQGQPEGYFSRQSAVGSQQSAVGSPQSRVRPSPEAPAPSRALRPQPRVASHRESPALESPVGSRQSSPQPESAVPSPIPSPSLESPAPARSQPPVPSPQPPVNTPSRNNRGAGRRRQSGCASPDRSSPSSRSRTCRTAGSC